MPFRYILRYTIDPVFHANDRIDELVEFCQSSRIDEVMYLFTAEELSQGHPSREICEPWIELACQLRDRLAEVGVALSLNPWTTTYHEPRGRTLFAGQNFQTMVGENGVPSPLTACPLDENWQNYLCDLFGEWVQRVKPVALWIEDDWRLHNHGVALGYGGCFCKLHMNRFSRMAGQPVTRETLLNAILAPGAPHPWRTVWLELCRETMLEAAKKLRSHLRKAHPQTRVGLMSSMPDTHSMEGRDWQKMQDILADGTPFLIRPHMPPYTEAVALHTPPSVTRQTIANHTRPLLIYPELENSPRCGPYSKSHRFDIWECLHSASFGAAGITINDYDMMGNGITLNPGLGRALAEAKPRLSALASLEIDDAAADGVDVLFHPELAANVHCVPPNNNTAHDEPNTSNTRGVTGMALLRGESTVWSRTLYTLGIAHRLTPSVRTDERPVAVNGQTLRCFSDAQIETLLKGPVLMDALSAEVLLERGYGRDIGIHSGRWITLNDTGYGYEQICENDPDVYGLANPRMTASRCSDCLFDMTLLDGCDIMTEIRRPDHATVCPGLVIYRNSRGGTIATWAYPMDGRHQFYMAFFNTFRRILLQRMLVDMITPAVALAMAECDTAHVYRVPTKQGVLLGWLNPTNDPHRQIILTVTGMDTISTVHLLQQDGQWVEIDYELVSLDGMYKMIIQTQIQPLGGQFLMVS